MRAKIITIFGSGSARENSRPFELAYEVGFLLAKAGFTIANGGYGGVMLASAKGAKAAGGQTIGVTTDEFRDSRRNQFIDREIRKPTWHKRLHKLVGYGDGFVVLDGGTGTLTELFVAWEMLNKEFHSKPIAVLGQHMQAGIRALTSNPEIHVPKELHFVSTPEEALQYLKEYLIRA